MVPEPSSVKNSEIGPSLISNIDYPNSSRKTTVPKLIKNEDIRFNIAQPYVPVQPNFRGTMILESIAEDI